ncbi:hypothetical protein [Sphingomonas jatrophae]|uniref:Uncharacterized protein n=1 Tax=Sphingomonas jatrophae TaxID=1166337 RepID=A0A1I6K6F6_9SPHN|nr:hypothetical protein [Sphingomonas jatrophae]SFR86833.1 hypothetical protein SAMN05192580_1380 [Sphingomonas jatrophae]
MNKPTAIERLRAAVEFVQSERQAKRSADTIIAGLVERYGARHRSTGQEHQLRAAGVASSCTWSRDEGLLTNWERTAGLRLIGHAQGGFGRE